MPHSKKTSVDRRGFLKGAALGTAALVATPSLAEPQNGQTRSVTPLPSANGVAAETSPPPPRVDVYTTDRPGSDFMVDVIKSLGFEYICRQPGLDLPRSA